MLFHQLTEATINLHLIFVNLSFVLEKDGPMEKVNQRGEGEDEGEEESALELGEALPEHLAPRGEPRAAAGQPQPQPRWRGSGAASKATLLGFEHYVALPPIAFAPARASPPRNSRSV